jgi:hypothetical protein
VSLAARLSFLPSRSSTRAGSSQLLSRYSPAGETHGLIVLTMPSMADRSHARFWKMPLIQKSTFKIAFIVLQQHKKTIIFYKRPGWIRIRSDARTPIPRSAVLQKAATPESTFRRGGLERVFTE